MWRALSPPPASPRRAGGPSSGTRLRPQDPPLSVVSADADEPRVKRRFRDASRGRPDARVEDAEIRTSTRPVAGELSRLLPTAGLANRHREIGQTGRMAAMELLERAREAFAARRWDVAYATYGSCDGLSGDDLDALAETAHWLGRPDESVVAYTEAYRLHREAGRLRRASLSALLIACHLRFQGAGVEADGWLARCVRLLSRCRGGPRARLPPALGDPTSAGCRSGRGVGVGTADAAPRRPLRGRVPRRVGRVLRGPGAGEAGTCA